MTELKMVLVLALMIIGLILILILGTRQIYLWEVRKLNSQFKKDCREMVKEFNDRMIEKGILGYD